MKVLGKLVLKAVQAVLLPLFVFPVLFIIDPPPDVPRLAWAIVAGLALAGIYGCELLIRRLSRQRVAVVILRRGR